MKAKDGHAHRAAARDVPTLLIGNAAAAWMRSRLRPHGVEIRLGVGVRQCGGEVRQAGERAPSRRAAARGGTAAGSSARGTSSRPTTTSSSSGSPRSSSSAWKGRRGRLMPSACMMARRSSRPPSASSRVGRRRRWRRPDRTSSCRCEPSGAARPASLAPRRAGSHAPTPHVSPASASQFKTDRYFHYEGFSAEWASGAEYRGPSCSECAALAVPVVPLVALVRAARRPRRVRGERLGGRRLRPGAARRAGRARTAATAHGHYGAECMPCDCGTAGRASTASAATVPAWCAPTPSGRAG